MSRRDIATREKREPTVASLFGDAVALAQNAALAPLRITLNWTKWLARTATPPLIPLAVLAAMTPILLFMSLATGFYVWKSGAVGWLATLDLQYGDGAPPYAQTSLPAMSAIEPYDVILHLTLPATTANYELGNFMVALTLTTTKNRTVTSVRKPAIVLPPTRYLFRAPTKVHMSVPLLYDYIAGSTNLVATVGLGRKDGWKSIGPGVGREVSVLSASLEGVLKYRGTRGIVSRYPLLSAAVSAAAFFIVSFSTMALFLAPAVLWKYQEEEATTVKSEASAPSPVIEKPRRRKSIKRSSSRGADEGIKHESEDVTIPSSSSPTTPLRRRRSRISDQGDEE